MKPHKHCELIKAWADGAEIQVKVKNCVDGDYWIDEHFPYWNDERYEYRIKPEPKPDAYVFARIGFVVAYNKPIPTFAYGDEVIDNLKLIFDGETGELKSAEVLK